jgi:hypothetical protein
MQENRLQNVSARLTWQISSKNRLAAYDDRAFKSIGHECTSDQDVLTASKRRYSSQVLYAAGTKWTSTLSDKFLLETAGTVVMQNFHQLFNPESQRSGELLNGTRRRRALTSYSTREQLPVRRTPATTVRRDSNSPDLKSDRTRVRQMPRFERSIPRDLLEPWQVFPPEINPLPNAQGRRDPR